MSYRITDGYFQLQMIPLPFEKTAQMVAIATFLAAFGLMHLIYAVTKMTLKKEPS